MRIRTWVIFLKLHRISLVKQKSQAPAKDLIKSYPSFFPKLVQHPKLMLKWSHSTQLILKQGLVSTAILALGRIHAGMPELALNQVGILWSITISPELRLSCSLFSPVLQELKIPLHHQPLLNSAKVPCCQFLR